MQDMGIEKTDNLETAFMKRFGSLKCGDLRRNGPGCNNLVGAGKGSGAALMMFILGVMGVLMCGISSIFIRRYKYIED